MTTHTFDRAYGRDSATTLSSAAAGWSVAAAITLVFNAILTIVKDASAPLHDFMQSVLGHHWTTHGVVVLIVFLALGWVLSKSEGVHKLSDATLIGSVIAATVINGAAIALWFLFV
jgi:hypothetical protein